jgi:hypothetical protein
MESDNHYYFFGESRTLKLSDLIGRSRHRHGNASAQAVCGPSFSHSNRHVQPKISTEVRGPKVAHKILDA